jgi:hypothetical protein
MEVDGLLPCSQEPSKVPVMSQIDLVHTTHPISLSSILILSTTLRLGFPSGHFLSGFPTNILYAFLFSFIRATYPGHLILHDFIILIIVGEVFKLCSSSLCSSLQLPVISLRSKYSPQHPVLEHPQSIFLP